MQVVALTQSAVVRATWATSHALGNPHPTRDMPLKTEETSARTAAQSAPAEAHLCRARARA
eukprot:7973497-Lingulodinium_polyedra.AAC.1